MDPIADMLSAIKNALAVKKKTVDIPFSKIKEGISRILVKEGYLEKIEQRRFRGKKILRVFLKYDKENNPLISGLKRVSKPSRRVYKSYSELRAPKEGFGILIVSTSKGLLTDRKAKKLKVGGEVICEVW